MVLTFWARHGTADNFDTGTSISGHGMGDFHNANDADFLKFGIRSLKFTSPEYPCICRSRHG